MKRKADEMRGELPQKKARIENSHPFDVMSFLGRFWESVEGDAKKEEIAEEELTEAQLWEEAEHFFLNDPEAIKWKKDGNQFLKMADHRIYRREEFLGEGAFGKVYKVQSDDKEEYATKKETAKDAWGRKIEFPAPLISARLRTLQIMRTLDEVRSDILSTDKKKSYIVMKLKQGKELEKVIYVSEDASQKANLSLLKRYQIGLKCIEAVQKLHAQNVVHADLKPQNFMINEKDGNIEIFVIDYGFSRQLENDQVLYDFPEGTPFYAPPEFFEDKNRDNGWASKKVPYSKATDIYELGIMLTEDLSLDLEKDFTDKMLHCDHTKRATIHELHAKVKEKIIALEAAVVLNVRGCYA